MKFPHQSKIKAQVWVVENGKKRLRQDQLTTEEPLEIRLTSPSRTVAITMRTPGADFELVAGFLFSEGVINSKQDIQKMSYCTDESIDGEQRHNIINVQLKPGLNPDLQPLERHFYINSACGVCGKASIAALQLRGCAKITSDLTVKSEIIYSLSEQLRSHQGIFSATGGLHAAAVFDAEGTMLNLQEDVGRHNALDKLIGKAVLSEELPFNHHIVMVSGRSSFELLQKSVVAGVPIVCSVSAPSSLAVSVAEEFGITLVGFLRGTRFNIYTGWQRIMGT
ncbi:formate dehydrogenase family accessory protein FdhD [Anabaenopsis circularis NIES-21]|uniref:Sulfur carrier protein FdhD n=2 Tax=Nostocales TaxID=1161 RepID=A0A1Z4GII9_9CYAN|nr:formate dehydrogenase accessory sulfurtransferase FdhD [Nostoc cycadae]BAY17292.1 formate dehydrogenase family accessory protein FdhD [Anabaenopsis circularis NIES-21]GBE90977.1 FdhD protein [Nostoc cycadae WK-1]